MKYIIVFLLIATSNVLLGQRLYTITGKDTVWDTKGMEKIKKMIAQSEIAPMEQQEGGIVRVNDSLLADQTEIRVGEWLNYIYYHNLKNYPMNIFTKEPKNVNLFNDILNTNIDTTLLPDKNILDQLPEKYLFKKCKTCELIKYNSLCDWTSLPFEKDSLDNKQSKRRLLNYLELPIVGITYEQAIAFCNWRTTYDSTEWYIPKGFPPITFLTSRHEFVFKLPTPEEFDKLNPAADSIYNKKGIIAGFNYKGATYSCKKRRIKENNQCGKTRMTIFFNFPNYYRSTKAKYSDGKISEVQGNVAEMTTIKGVSRGGSYHHFAKDSYRGINNYYEKPELWLGFRCVVVRRKP